jgi:hypothetical protein
LHSSYEGMSIVLAVAWAWVVVGAADPLPAPMRRELEAEESHLRSEIHEIHSILQSGVAPSSEEQAALELRPGTPQLRRLFAPEGPASERGPGRMQVRVYFHLHVCQQATGGKSRALRKGRLRRCSGSESRLGYPHTQRPLRHVPFFVLLGLLISHLSGSSAGEEGC